MPTILVTGASGDTGRPTVERLREKGFQVRALGRKMICAPKDCVTSVLKSCLAT
jgi:nucleoside-diphosphate-sugar epimerase